MKIVDQMTAFYSVLDKQAEQQGDNKRFRGYVSAVYKAEGLPIGSYSKIVQRLQDMGCITVLERGAKAQQSDWLLHVAPTLELYESTAYNAEESELRKLKKRVKLLENRIEYIERKLENGSQDQG